MVIEIEPRPEGHPAYILLSERFEVGDAVAEITSASTPSSVAVIDGILQATTSLAARGAGSS
jgi:hypothetical protein